MRKMIKTKMKTFDEFLYAKLLIANLILQNKFDKALSLAKRWKMLEYYRYVKRRYNKVKPRISEIKRNKLVLQERRLNNKLSR